MIRLGKSDLDVYPLCLGGNVFGWTANEAESFEVLDAYVEAGGNFIDTADAYSHWVPGNVGGESEAIIGRWMAARGNRDQMIIATKVSSLPTAKGLAPETIRRGLEDSLGRLQTDHVDIYCAHYDDPETPVADYLAAFDTVIREGKVRHITASNYSPVRLQEALNVSKREGLAGFIALQHHYNLMHRTEYESSMRDVVALNGLASLPYYALAKGFLSGKYRPGVTIESSRASGAEEYLVDKGIAILGVLDAIAAEHRTSVAAVSLAWLAAQPTVATPLASARVVEQLPDILAMGDLHLTTENIASLDLVSA